MCGIIIGQAVFRNKLPKGLSTYKADELNEEYGILHVKNFHRCIGIMVFVKTLNFRL
jgi:hypothetical protein